MAAELPPFERLLDEHGVAIWRYLCARVGREAAGECYQETMLSALRGYPKLRDAENLRGWLFTIAARKVTDMWRDGARQPVPTPVPPERQTADAEPSDDRLWDRVRALPGGQRDAIALRFAADFAYSDIAGHLGCSEDAARQRVRAGLATLRATMKDER